MLGGFELSYMLEVNTCNEEIIKVNYIIQSIMLNNKLKKKKREKIQNTHEIRNIRIKTFS